MLEGRGGVSPERILKLHIDAEVTLCPVLTLHCHLEHPRITATGGEGKDGEELQEDREKMEVSYQRFCQGYRV